MLIIPMFLLDMIQNVKARFAGPTEDKALQVAEGSDHVVESDTAGKPPNKKRSREDDSRASEGESLAGPVNDAETTPQRIEEPVPKKVRVASSKNEYAHGVQSLIKHYLDRHTKASSGRGRLPSAYSERRRIAEDFKDIVLKTMNCKATSALFADRMAELESVADELQRLEREKKNSDLRVKGQLRRADREFDSQALAFLDGPFLFHVFGSLSGALKDRLFELRLPLEEIHELMHDLTKSRPGTLEQYGTTKDEATITAREILRWLDPSYYDRQPDAVSYNDVVHRNAHEQHEDNCVAIMKQANATLAHSVDKAFESLAKIQTLPQHSLQQSTTSHASPIIESKSRDSPNEKRHIATNIVENEANREIVINYAAQKHAHEKSLEISAHQSQCEETRRRKFLVDFHAYGTLIQELKTYREGGAHPNRSFMKELGMHDTRSCIHRLKLLWKKHSKAVQMNDVEQLRLDPKIYIPAAICLREAHCIMHMFLYHGSQWFDVAEAGWNLNQMRELQAEIVPWAHEEPLMYTKPDVDAICQALQDVHDQYTYTRATTIADSKRTSASLSKRQYAPVSKQVPVADQSTVANNAVVVNGIAFDQMIGKPVALAPPPSTIDTDGNSELMDLDQYEDIVLRQFESGQGDTLVGDVNRTYDNTHPSELKENSSCPFLYQGVGCPLGPDACIRVHKAGLQQQQPAQNAERNAATNADARFYMLAVNGKALDSRVANNICNNFNKGRCSNQRCPRIHRPNGSQPILGPTNSQQHQSYAGAQASPQSKACAYFANGSCRFGNECRDSHDPQTIAQMSVRPARFGDTRMGDAASSGDNNNVRAQNIYNQPCRWERQGPCSNKKCKYMHTNPQSKQYQNTNHQAQPHGNQRGTPGAPGVQDIQGAQGVQGAQNLQNPQGAQVNPRLPNDNTWNPNQGVRFAPPQDSHRVQQWANGVAQANQQPPRGACFSCGQMGHKSNACPHRNNAAGNNGGAMNNGPGGNNGGRNNNSANNAPKTCHTCGMEGHFSRECPNNGNNSNNGGGYGGNRGAGHSAGFGGDRGGGRGGNRGGHGVGRGGRNVFNEEQSQGQAQDPLFGRLTSQVDDQSNGSGGL